VDERVVPVHLLYWTAWAEEDGTIHFRPDIYDRSRRRGQHQLVGRL
jgi:L,D-transpeptidase YcbB